MANIRDCTDDIGSLGNIRKRITEVPLLISITSFIGPLKTNLQFIALRVLQHEK